MSDQNLWFEEYMALLRLMVEYDMALAVPRVREMQQEAIKRWGYNFPHMERN